MKKIIGIGYTTSPNTTPKLITAQETSRQAAITYVQKLNDNLNDYVIGDETSKGATIYGIPVEEIFEFKIMSTTETIKQWREGNPLMMRTVTSTLVETVANKIDDLFDDDKAQVWNDYCDNSSCPDDKIGRIQDDFNDFCAILQLDALDIIEMVGSEDMTEEWFREDKYNFLTGEVDYFIDTEEIALHILDNDTDLDNEHIKAILADLTETEEE